MKPRERQILWLAYAEGYSHREIAEVTGLASASIRLLLFRAREDRQPAARSDPGEAGMMLRACPREKELAALIQRGQWPAASPAELGAHVGVCRGCGDLSIAMQAFQAARAESIRAVQPAAAGVLWWRAQLRRRKAAVERIGRPSWARRSLPCRSRWYLSRGLRSGWGGMVRHGSVGSRSRPRFISNRCGPRRWRCRSGMQCCSPRPSWRWRCWAAWRFISNRKSSSCGRHGSSQSGPTPTKLSS